jgi:hypothetical protein
MRKMGGQEYFLTYLLLHPIIMVLVTPPLLLTLILLLCSISFNQIKDKRNKPLWHEQKIQMMGCSPWCENLMNSRKYKKKKRKKQQIPRWESIEIIKEKIEDDDTSIEKNT